MRITITTDDGQLVSQWRDADDDDRRYLRTAPRLVQPLDSEWAGDLARDMGAARRLDGRDPETGDRL